MTKLIQKSNSVLVAISQMVQLAWQADPLLFLSLLVTTIVQAIIPVGMAWILKLIFDLLGVLLQTGETVGFMQQVFPLITVQAALLLLSKTIQPGSKYLNDELGRRLAVLLPVRIYRKINSFTGIAYFETPQFYDVLRLSQEGAQHGVLTIVNTITSLVQGIVTLTIFLGVLLTLDPIVALLVSLVAVPQLLVQLHFGGEQFELAHKLSADERKSFYFGFLLSGIEAAKEIRLFGLGDYFIDQFVRIHQKVNAAKRRQELRELSWETGLELLTTFAGAAAFVVIILWAFRGRLSVGDITLYNSAVTSVQVALYTIVLGLSQLNMHILFFSYYQSLMAMPQPIPVTESPRSVPPLSTGIELRNVSFRYSEAHPWVLREINLLIPAGKCVALVGLNGAGKSTLAKLLTRLYDPVEGEILWDGVDIREMDPCALRQRIGAIFQDFMRYELSVRENIGLGNLHRINDLEWVQQAARQANVHQDILELCQEYETELSRAFVEVDQGTDLSGGQWQKVATARMFARDADLLLLDEPTSALDARAEYEVYRQFAELMAGRTSILISHRFSTVRMADYVAVLENGRITEYGSHDALMLLCGTYAGLYQMQTESYYDK